jgi:hypothetical protein
MFVSESKFHAECKAEEFFGTTHITKPFRWNGYCNYSIKNIHTNCFDTRSQPPIQRVPGALSVGVKRPGREVDHSRPSSAEVMKAWSYSSTPPIRLHGVALSWKKHRDSFTFTLSLHPHQLLWGQYFRIFCLVFVASFQVWVLTRN